MTIHTGKWEGGSEITYSTLRIERREPNSKVWVGYQRGFPTDEQARFCCAKNNAESPAHYRIVDSRGGRVVVA